MTKQEIRCVVIIPPRSLQGIPSIRCPIYSWIFPPLTTTVRALHFSSREDFPTFFSPRRLESDLIMQCVEKWANLCQYPHFICFLLVVTFAVHFVFEKMVEAHCRVYETSMTNPDPNPRPINTARVNRHADATVSETDLYQRRAVWAVTSGDLRATPTQQCPHTLCPSSAACSTTTLSASLAVLQQKLTEKAARDISTVPRT